MKENGRFLDAIIEKSSFKNFSKQKIMTLQGRNQTKELVEFVHAFGDDFFILYFSGIDRIGNLEAEEAFFNIVKNSSKLIKSEPLYKNIKDNLENKYIKSSYTRLYKKNR